MAEIGKEITNPLIKEFEEKYGDLGPFKKPIKSMMQGFISLTYRDKLDEYKEKVRNDLEEVVEKGNKFIKDVLELQGKGIFREEIPLGPFSKSSIYDTGMERTPEGREELERKKEQAIKERDEFVKKFKVEDEKVIPVS